MGNKTIGLVMSYTGSSYGMNLQAVATQCIIENLGYDTEIIQSKSTSTLRGIPFDFGLFVYLSVRILSAKKNRRIEEESVGYDELHIRNDNERVAAAKEFREKYLHNFTEVMTFDQLESYSKKYDAVLIGSDQGWLPGFAFGRRNSLRFVPKGVKKISYSTSLGVSTFPWYCYRSSRNVWKSFNNISVREEEGKKVIHDICGNDIQVDVVADPTYLLSKTEWETLIPVEQLESEPYVLSFILGNNEKQQMCARRFANMKGLKLVSILSNESVSSIDASYADRLVIGASPSDFLNYVRGAAFIFTDSFHGIAFSIINEIQLFVFYRKRAGASGKNSRNSRIDNILRLWGISNSLISDPDVDWNNYDIPSIDYHRVNVEIEKMKNVSFAYLKKALPSL